MTISDPDRGRRQLLWSIGSGTAMLVALGISEYFRTGTLSALSLLGRPFVFAALGRLAFEGRVWAPRVAGVWIALLAIVAGGNGVPVISTHPIAALILFALGCSYVLVGYRLVASVHIREFVAQRARLLLTRSQVSWGVRLTYGPQLRTRIALSRYQCSESSFGSSRMQSSSQFCCLPRLGR